MGALEAIKTFLALPVVGIIATVLINLALMFILVKGLKKAEQHFARRLAESGRSDAAGMLRILRCLISAVVYILFGASILSQIPGLQTLINSLLASSGIVALVGGIAAQDTLGNMISGAMIRAFRPFQKGDTVRYVDKDITGVVEDITLRHTVIRTFENKRVLVPNGTINKEVIENANFLEDRVCNFFDVGITYESDLERALALLREEVLACPGYTDRRTEAEKKAGAPDVVVRVQSFDDSAVVIRALVWSEDFDAGTQMKSDLRRAVKARFDREGISIAYPHMVVVQQ